MIRSFTAAAIVLAALVVPGCGPGGGDSVEGIYTGPTTPAQLTGEQMGDLEDEANWAIQATFITYQLSTLLQLESDDDSLSAKPRALFDTAPRDVVVDEIPIDQVIDLAAEGGSGWIRIVGVIRNREDIELEMRRIEQVQDLTIEFHDAAGGELLAGMKVTGSTHLAATIVGTTTEDEQVQTAAVRSDAADLRFESTLPGGDLTGLVINGSFQVDSEMHDVLGQARVAWSTASSDMVVRKEPSGEQLRFVGSWSNARSGSSVTEADVDGTLFSTLLGGAVRFSSSSTYDEGAGLVLTTLASWDGGAMRLTGHDFETRPAFDVGWDLDGDGTFETDGLPSTGTEGLILMGLNMLGVYPYIF